MSLRTRRIFQEIHPEISEFVCTKSRQHCKFQKFYMDLIKQNFVVVKQLKRVTFGTIGTIYDCT